MQYGTILKEWRKANKLTQQEVGDRLKLTASYISMMESNSMSVTLTTLESIARLVGMSMGQFYAKAYNEKTYQEGFKDATRIAAGFFGRISEFEPDDVELIIKSLENAV